MSPSIKKLTCCSIIFWLVSFSLLIYGHMLQSARGAEPESPRFAGPDSNIDWERSGPDVSRPNEFQIRFLEKLKIFDQTYYRWQTEQQVNGEGWENLADRVFSEYLDIPSKGENEPFVLRGRLIVGECLLFAAVDHMKKNRKSDALRNYRKGLRILQDIISIEDIYQVTDLLTKNTTFDKLPDYRRQDVYVPYEEKKVLHPYAGYETIGIRISGVPSGKAYSTIDQLQAELRENLTFIQDYSDYNKPLSASQADPSPESKKGYLQKTTTDTARDLLSDFCPWGLTLFSLMEQAGLTDDLDFRILRPFSGYTPTTLEKFITGLKQAPDLLMGRAVTAGEEIPPVISEVVLERAQIPKHIQNEMNRIIGDRKKGFLDPHQSRPINWAWVEKEPTYTMWYISPTVFDWKASDYLWLWLTALKACADPKGLLYDEVFNQLINTISLAYGKNSDMFFCSKVCVEANDKGFLTTDFMEKGKWPSGIMFIKKISSLAFGSAEEQMRKNLYGANIDPKKFSKGKTYNGDSIPPIMMRADVCGFEQVPDDEYLRTIQAVRFYLLYPANDKGPFKKYDLKNPCEGAMVQKLAWHKLPDPLNTYEVVTDFAPKKQRIDFHLGFLSPEIIANQNEICAELWTIDPDDPELYAMTFLNPDQQIFSFELYNKNNSNGKSDFEKKMAQWQLARPTTQLLVSNLDKIKNSLELMNMKMRTVLVDIKSQYQLKLSSNGKNVSAPYRVILDKGRKAQREITGAISSPEPGSVVLDYSPEVEIVTLKTTFLPDPKWEIVIEN